MSLDDHFDDGEAETLSCCARGLLWNLIETLEDTLLVFGGDATSGIAHGQCCYANISIVGIGRAVGKVVERGGYGDATI